MKNLLLSLLMGAILFVTGSASAFNVPTPTGYVTDTSGKLTSSQVNQLNQRLTDYQRRSTNEIAVVLVSSLGGENLEDVTHQVFQTYKVGKAGLDNGVLLFIAVNDRKMRLQTGKGIEGEITDIQANDILASMKPSFRSNDFNRGVNIALDQIQSKLDSRVGRKADPGAGQQFNKPVQTEATTTTKSSGSCSVSVSDSGVGNTAGWTFGLLALLVGVIAFARRHILNREVKKVQELEAKVDAEIAAEKDSRQQRYAERFEKAKVLVVPSPVVDEVKTPPSHWGGALPPVVSQKYNPRNDPHRHDEVPVRLPSHDAATAAATVRHTPGELAEANDLVMRRLEENAERKRHQDAVSLEQKNKHNAELRALEEAVERERTEAKRKRIEREESDRRKRDDEDRQRSETTTTVVSSWSDSSSSSSSSSDSGGSWDSGFGGGDSGGGGSSSDW